MIPPLELDALAAVEPAAFTVAVAPLFEGAPRFLARLAVGRPDHDWDALFARARAIAHALPADEQVELINAHPRLGAPADAVSSLSFLEQGYDHDEAGRVADSVEAERERVAAELERLNAAYEARFGFRYCVHVAGRPRAALLPDMAAALDADPASERHRALDAVVDIATARLSALRGATT